MKQNAGVFEDLLAKPGDPKWLDDIRKDLHRQFPLHEMFQDPDGPGLALLKISKFSPSVIRLIPLSLVKLSCFVS